jgi:hypothetical protein
VGYHKRFAPYIWSCGSDAIIWLFRRYFFVLTAPQKSVGHGWVSCWYKRSINAKLWDATSAFSDELFFFGWIVRVGLKKIFDTVYIFAVVFGWPISFRFVFSAYPATVWNPSQMINRMQDLSLKIVRELCDSHYSKIGRQVPQVLAQNRALPEWASMFCPLF